MAKGKANMYQPSGKAPGPGHAIGHIAHVAPGVHNLDSTVKGLLVSAYQSAWNGNSKGLADLLGKYTSVANPSGAVAAIVYKHHKR